MRLSEWRWRRLLKVGGALLTLALAAGALFVWSGIYNVAASSDHWAITTWILERVRVQSVETWSAFVEKPPPLTDPDVIRVGAAHFEGGCTPCHSRPGDPANAIVSAMLPPPPPLTRSIRHLDAKEIFWIIKHGLKFTAMPAWPSQLREDEVWMVTSFLVRLNDLSRQDYLELSGVTRTLERRSNAELAASSESVALTECVRCHGDATLPPVSRFVPLLNGQSRAYLERALAEYTATTRPSGIMQPVASLLTEAERRRIATWYAGLDPPKMPPPEAPGDLERGHELAHRGDPEKGIPPCLACHSDRHPQSFPSLAGQNAPYLVTQLSVFRSGGRDTTVYGQIMAVIARRLSRQQVEDVARYFASLPPGNAPSHAEAGR